jgi:hypothetical protein
MYAACRTFAIDQKLVEDDFVLFEAKARDVVKIFIFR